MGQDFLDKLTYSTVKYLIRFHVCIFYSSLGMYWQSTADIWSTCLTNISAGPVTSWDDVADGGDREYATDPIHGIRIRWRSDQISQGVANLFVERNRESAENNEIVLPKNHILIHSITSWYLQYPQEVVTHFI